MEIIDGIWTSHSLIRELKGIPDGFVFAVIGEERYRIANIKRVPTCGNLDDVSMNVVLNLEKCEGGNLC